MNTRIVKEGPGPQGGEPAPQRGGTTGGSFDPTPDGEVINRVPVLEAEIEVSLDPAAMVILRIPGWEPLGVLPETAFKPRVIRIPCTIKVELDRRVTAFQESYRQLGRISIGAALELLLDCGQLKKVALSVSEGQGSSEFPAGYSHCKPWTALKFARQRGAGDWTTIAINEIVFAKLEDLAHRLKAEKASISDWIAWLLSDFNTDEWDGELVQSWVPTVRRPGRPRGEVFTVPRCHLDPPCAPISTGVCPKGDPACPKHRLSGWDRDRGRGAPRQPATLRPTKVSRSSSIKRSHEGGRPMVTPRPIDPKTGLPEPYKPPGVMETLEEPQDRSGSNRAPDTPEKSKSITGDPGASEGILTGKALEAQQKADIERFKKMGIWEGD